MKLRAFLAGLLLAVSATSTLAAGPYLGAAGGVSILHNGDINVAGIGSVEAEYDTGFGFNVTAGYNFEPVRLEFDLGYKNADMDKVSGPGGSISVPDTDFAVGSVMVNALYDITTKTAFTPYVGAGLGLLVGELETDGEEYYEADFGYQLIAGAAYNLNKNLALDISYRFQHAPSDFSDEGVDIEYMSSAIMAGIRLNF